MNHWDYYFAKVTAWFATQPSYAPKGQFPYLAGVDGRFDGVLRRYPGAVRYGMSGSAFNRGTNAELVEPFEIETAPGSNILIRGMLTTNSTDTSPSTIAVWRRDDDAADSFRKTTLQAQDYALYESQETGSAAPTFTIGSPPAKRGDFRNDNLPGLSVKSMVMFDDGTTDGEVPYICGDFQLIGSRHCSGVARLVSGVWEPVGIPGFNAPCDVLHVFDGELYAGGEFTEYDSGEGISKHDANIAYLAKWTGEEWVKVGDFATAVSSLSPDSGGFTCAASNDDYFVLAGTMLKGAKYIIAVYDKSGDSWDISASNDRTVNARVEGLAFYDDGTVDGNEHLWVVGQFDNDGGATATTIDGLFVSNTHDLSTSWTLEDPAVTTGAPTTTDCYAVEVFDGDIYISFVNTGAATSTDSHGVMTYTTGGSSWSIPIAQDDTAYASLTGTPLPRCLYSDGTRLVLIGKELEWDSGGPDDGWLYTTDGSTWSSIANTSTLDGRAALASSSGGLFYGTAHTVSALTNNSKIIGTNDVLSVVQNGPFAYLYASNGNHKVLKYNSTNDDLEIVPLGVGKVILPGATATGRTGGGTGVAGNVAGYYRYVDRTRGRYTGISYASTTALLANDDHYDIAPTGDEFAVAPLGFDRVQGFSTISSEDANLPPPGLPFRAIEGKISDATSAFVSISFFEDEATDDGEGTMESAVNDSELAVDPRRTYDFVIEEAGELNQVYAAAIYQGTTFVVEARGAYLQLRHSPAFRTELENFPITNEFPLGVATTDAKNAQFVQAADYLYLLVGAKMFRIQKAGTRVALIEVHSGFPWVSRRGAVAVGANIFAVHENGVMVIQARSGNMQEVSRVHRIFYDIWRSVLEPGTVGDNMITVAYDARMRCVYIHHRALHETLCFWLASDKVTMLVDNPVFGCFTAPEFDDGTSRRAWFYDEFMSFVCTPNWDFAPTAYQTATGFPLTTGGNVRYNTSIESSTDSSLGWYVLEFPDAPFEARLSADRIPIAFLTGALAGRSATAIASADNQLSVYSTAASGPLAPGALTEAELASIESGDIVALDTIPFELVGSNLWTRDYQSSFRTLKRIDAIGIQTNRVSSPGTYGGQTTPLESSYGLFQGGSLRHADVIAGEPREGVVSRRFVPRRLVDILPGQPLDARIGANYAELHDEGTLLYPYIQCLTSNLAFEINLLTVSGHIGNSDQEGA